MQQSRREIVVSLVAATLTPFLSFGGAFANDLPTSLKDSKEQLYNYLLTWTTGQGMSDAQKLVLNSLIQPFDIAADTPYHNDEIFRQYADRTFRGGTEAITGSTPASMAERFSSQYRVVLNAAAQQVDQDHPEIRQRLRELRSHQQAATKAFTDKITELETAWGKVVGARGLKPDSPDYTRKGPSDQWYSTKPPYSTPVDSYDSQDIQRFQGQDHPSRVRDIQNSAKWHDFLANRFPAAKQQLAENNQLRIDVKFASDVIATVKAAKGILAATFTGRIMAEAA